MFQTLEKKLIIAGYILLIPALFINLGLVSFIEDEGTRSIVALEMLFTGDFITPKISGDYYLNKPPVYNWIIAASFSLFDSYTNFAMRFPMALSLIFYGLTTALLLKRYYGRYKSFAIGLSLIVCARILFYDSLHGLMDITFAWLIYMMMMLAYIFYERKQYFVLFISCYLLTAITFLMKGVPALAFLGITLLTLFIWKKEFKKLFSIQHIAGFSLFLLITGSYYFIYSRANDMPVENALLTLLKRASVKSFTGNPLQQTIVHFFQFPLDVLVTFLPFSVLLPLLLVKSIRINLFKDDLVRYCTWIFFTNIIIYWVSTIVYPRYLLMFVPLAYIILLNAYFVGKHHVPKITRWVDYVFYLVFIVFIAFPVIILFQKNSHAINYKYLISALSIVAFLFLLYLFYKFEAQRIMIILIAFLAFRVVFNLTVLPIRYVEAWDVKLENSAREAGVLMKGKELYMYDYYIPTLNHDQYKDVIHQYTFYVMAEYGDVIPFDTNNISEAYYLARPDSIRGDEPYRIVKDLYMGNHIDLKLIQFE